MFLKLTSNITKGRETAEESKCYYLLLDRNKRNVLAEKMKKKKLTLGMSTAWKVSKYGVISGSCFPIFGLNTGKYEPEITSYLDTFHAVEEFSLDWQMTQSGWRISKRCEFHFPTPMTENDKPQRKAENDTKPK